MGSQLSRVLAHPRLHVEQLGPLGQCLRLGKKRVESAAFRVSCAYV